MERFFGRKNEIKKLVNTFARVQKGGFEQALISGPAGVGKTTLVRQLAFTAEQHGGSFVFGKADLRRVQTPLAPVRAALDMMVKKTVANHPKDLAGVAKAIIHHLGSGLDQAITLVPALGFLFDNSAVDRSDNWLAGSQPEDETPFINNLLYSLIEALLPRSKGLVIFLDDLQWLDAASHKFLAHLSVTPALSGVLLVLGFRSQEDNPLPGLSRTRDLFQSLGTCMSLELKGLYKRDVAAFLKERLATRQDVKPFSDLCYEKTHGNPFYLIQLVDDLLETGAVKQKNSEWEYDIPRITAVGISENVADLIISRMQMLDDDALVLLKQGACIQGGIPASVLAKSLGLELEKIETLLWKSLQVKFLEKRESEYHFSHDKILEAVDSLITSDERVAIHRRLAAYYMGEAQGAGLKTSVFTLLHHYAYYCDTVTDPEQRKQMVDFYFTAGQEAKENNAYAEALDWLKKGLAHFPGDIWEMDYGLSLAFYRLAAECAYLAGDFEAAKQLFAQVDENARSFDDQLDFEMIKISCYQTSNKLERALSTGIGVLKHLGVNAPANPSWPRVGIAILRAWALVVTGWPSFFKKRKGQGKDRASNIAKVTSALGSIGFNLDPNKFLPFITSVAVEYSIRLGVSRETPLQYISFGMVLNHLTGSVRWGRRLGAVAGKLSSKVGSEKLMGKQLFLATYFLNHWDQSRMDIVAAYEQGQKICLRHGDHEFYGYNVVVSLYYYLMNGAPLEWIREKTIRQKNLFERLNHSYGLNIIRIQQQIVDNLLLGHSRPWEFDNDGGGQTQENDPESAYDLSFYRLCAAFFCGRYDIALKIREASVSILEEETSVPVYYYICFISVMAELNAGTNQKKIKKYLKILKRCASNNPGVYQPWHLMALGESYRHQGHLNKAEDCFQTVHKSLEKEPQALFEKGLVLECLGRVAEAQEDVPGAEEYFQVAVTLYRQWGLKWRQGLFDPNEKDEVVPKPVQPNQIQQTYRLEDFLFAIQDVCSARVVHAAVLEARHWKSLIYVTGNSIQRPAIFIDLPQKMLGFVAAAGKVVTAVAGDSEEDFFDTDYFFRHRPECLLVVPGGNSKGICIENPGQDVDMDTVTRLAEQSFETLEFQVAVEPDQPEKDLNEIQRLKICCQHLQDHMKTDTPYQNKNLTISATAKALEISPRKISDAINIFLGQNFQVFVNNYRVEAVKTRMQNPEAKDKAILDIALEEGFSSKSTFNRIFKKQTGMTPSQYLKERPWKRDGQTT